MENEIFYVLIDMLAKAKNGMRQDQLLEESPFDEKLASRALIALMNIGFVEKKDGGSEICAITKEITAYQLIKLGEFGIDMATLSGMVKVSEKQKQAAMALASEAKKLEKIEQDLKTKRAAEMSRGIESPAPRDSIVETLERLALASESSIRGMKGKKNVGKEVLAALQDAKNQATKALKDYQDQLRQGGADHIGF